MDANSFVRPLNIASPALFDRIASLWLQDETVIERIRRMSLTDGWTVAIGKLIPGHVHLEYLSRCIGYMARGLEAYAAPHTQTILFAVAQSFHTILIRGKRARVVVDFLGCLVCNGQ